VTSVVEAVEGLVLDSHRQNEVVVRNDVAIVQNDVFVRTIDIDHTGIEHTDATLEHQLLELFASVTGRVCLEIGLLLGDVVVG
jgi:hypothetical protein